MGAIAGRGGTPGHRWEHAIISTTKPPPDYLKAIWNVINWAQAEENYQAALK